MSERVGPVRQPRFTSGDSSNQPAQGVSRFRRRCLLRSLLSRDALRLRREAGLLNGDRLGILEPDEVRGYEASPQCDHVSSLRAGLVLRDTADYGRDL